jgi:quercetin dioxygenase-like cupin family protein
MRALTGKMAWLGAVLCLLIPTAVLAESAPVAWNVDDAELEWGPCPDFLPEGCRLAVLHGDPAGHNADVLFQLPANSKAPLHWHSSAERMVLISGEFHIDYDGHDTVVMHPGTYAFGPAGLPHTAHCLDAGPCNLFIAFEAPVDAVPGRPNEQ